VGAAARPTAARAVALTDDPAVREHLRRHHRV